MPDGSWGDRLKLLGQDLVTIEVNTILADGMTGRKMPPYPEALYDIAKRFARYLCECTRLDLTDFFAQAQALEDGNAPHAVAAADDLKPSFGGAPGVPETLTNGERDFRRLRWAAKQVIDHQREAPAGAALTPEILTIVHRVHRHSGQLELMVGGFAKSVRDTGLIGVDGTALYQGLRTRTEPLPMLSAVDLTRIRKIWEIGVDAIVLQSVLQLDGDIVFRADKNLDLETRKSLVAAHRQFVELGVTHWRAMFELLASLMGSALGRLLPGR